MTVLYQFEGVAVIQTRFELSTKKEHILFKMNNGKKLPLNEQGQNNS